MSSHDDESINNPSNNETFQDVVDAQFRAAVFSAVGWPPLARVRI